MRVMTEGFAKMTIDRFSQDEESLRARLLVLKDLVAEQDLHEKPCPLLATQLRDLDVLCARLHADVRRLAECVKKAGYSR